MPVGIRRRAVAVKEAAESAILRLNLRLLEQGAVLCQIPKLQFMPIMERASQSLGAALK